MENINYEDFLIKPKDDWIRKSTTNVYCNLNALPDIVKVLREVVELAEFRRNSEKMLMRHVCFWGWGTKNVPKVREEMTLGIFTNSVPAE